MTDAELLDLITRLLTDLHQQRALIEELEAAVYNRRSREALRTLSNVILDRQQDIARLIAELPE